MPNLTVSNAVDTFMQAADREAMREAIGRNSGVIVEESTTARTLAVSDAFKYIRCSNNNPVAITVSPQADEAWEDGAEIIIEQAGAGPVTVQGGAGVTVQSTVSSTSTSMQLDLIGLKRVAEDTWNLVVTSIARQNTANYAANQTLTAAECFGYVVYVTAAATLQLPPVADGMSVSVITIGDVEVSLDPDGVDRIWLDGTALGDGDKITNNSATGDTAVLTYFSADGWYAATNGWTGSGP